MTDNERDGLRLPGIYPITDRRLTGLSHLEQVRRLAAGGAPLVQLREKLMSPRAFYDEAVEAVAFAHANGVKVIINDRIDIALAVRADGVHLGQTDVPPGHARRILGSGAVIGFSTHSVAQAVGALGEGADYLAIGPVFTTGTKENPDPEVGTEGVRRVREAVGPVPLVAIGGIGEETVSEVIASGADSAALISAVLLPPGEIESNYRRLSEIVRSV